MQALTSHQTVAIVPSRFPLRWSASETGLALNNMKLIAISALIITVFALVVVHASVYPPQATDKPVEQTRKNIQVLKGLPESQLFPAMNFVGDSLGVHCDYCHVKEADKWLWEKDDKKNKLVGREMMRMVLELNRTKFDGEPVVTCYSCHRGSTRVERMAPLPPKDFAKEALHSDKTVLPEAREVVAKYLTAVGAKADALSKPIVMKGIAERSFGAGPLEIVFKQPNKLFAKQTTSQGIIIQASNGTTGWIQTTKSTTQMTAETLRQFNTLLALFNPIKIPDSIMRAEVTGIAKVDDHDTYALTIADNATQSTHLYFDVESGLLLRIVTVTNTMLGPLNTQRDFNDYRDIGGLKLPFTIRTSDVAAFDTAIRRFSEIKIDLGVDDRIFEMPRTAAP